MSSTLGCAGRNRSLLQVHRRHLGADALCGHQPRPTLAERDAGALGWDEQQGLPVRRRRRPQAGAQGRHHPLPGRRHACARARPRRPGAEAQQRCAVAKGPSTSRSSAPSPAYAMGEMDLMANFAYELPLRMICRILGIPDSDVYSFRDWTKDLLIGESFNASDEVKVRGATRGRARVHRASHRTAGLPKERMPTACCRRCSRRARTARRCRTRRSFPWLAA